MHMYLRGLTWLAATAVVVGVLVALDTAPSDPVRTSDEAVASRTAVIVYGCADRDPRLGSIEWETEADQGGVSDPFASGWPVNQPLNQPPRRTGFVRPAAWLAAYGGLPARSSAVIQVVEALRLAREQKLDAPVLIYSDMMFHDSDLPHRYERTRIGWPASCTVVLPLGAPIVRTYWHDAEPAQWTELELADAVLAAGDERSIALVESRWLAAQLLSDAADLQYATLTPNPFDALEKERDALVSRLIDRVRSDVRGGNPSGAIVIARELTRRKRGFVSESVDSRLVELIADLAFDPKHGREFRLLAGKSGIAEGATERLRHSDPEMRWAARLLLGGWDKSWGDRYLKALRVLDETGEIPAFETP